MATMKIVLLLFSWYLQTSTSSPLEPGPSFHLSFPMGSKNSSVRLSTSFRNPLDAVTVCYRIRPSLLKASTHNSIFSYATAPGRHNELLLSIGPQGRPQVYIRNEETKMSTTATIRFQDGVWFHVCVSWSDNGGVVLYAKDGSNGIQTNELVTPKNNDTIHSGGVIILGQDQDVVNGAFQPTQVFNGDLADLHVWDYVLPASAVLEYTKCNPTIEGNVISWNNLPMHLNEVEVHYHPRSVRPFCSSSCAETSHR